MNDVYTHFEQGINAFYAGLDVDDNPHDDFLEPFEHDEWEAGWYLAESEKV